MTLTFRENDVDIPGVNIFGSQCTIHDINTVKQITRNDDEQLLLCNAGVVLQQNLSTINYTVVLVLVM